MNLFSDGGMRPLADRVRPQTLEEFIGQTHIVGEGQFLRTMVERGQPSSLIFWGPPGTGKTTLARIIATSTGFAFEEISAVTSGLPEVKKVIERAAERKKLGEASILFVDEIHRFNKAQQDAFLPHVENGTIILIGATTENPSFEVIGPLLSRARVVVLKALSTEQILAIVQRGAKELGAKQLDSDAAHLLAQLAAGDARVALGGLETAAQLSGSRINLESVRQAMQKPGLKYDKSGEYHYNLISAYIKSMRGGAVDAALFYLARMLEGGEDPKFIARRMVIFASEDIGVGDSAMLTLAVSTFQAIERIGLPEGRIVLGHATIALTSAPKDRRATDAIAAATSAALAHPEAEVPLHLRNAPTKLMKELQYGKGYEWEAGFEHTKGFMPGEVKGQKFFRPEA
ncbi:MAG TPA: replication-associated recombination protein A [Candidatus Saccharimonadia bacterium]|jgi:putative ATPase|nr:replication-associated recombination protein A [Candidatus Saccharimonadia bacterium]